MGLRGFFGGFVLATALWGCGAMTFGYKYYGMEFADFPKGRLVGPKPVDDLDFSQCKSNGCVVMLRGPFFSLKKDHETCKSDLVSCQRGQ